MSSISELTKAMEEFNFDSRGPLAAFKSRKNKTANRNLMGLNEDVNRTLATSTSDSTKALLKKLEKISDEAITADAEDSQKLLNELKAMKSGIAIISDPTEREKTLKLFAGIRDNLNVNSNWVRKASTFVEKRLPDAVGTTAAMTGSPLLTAAVKYSMVGLGKIMDTSKKDEQKSLIRSLLDSTKDERSGLNEKVQDVEEAIKKSTPSTEEKSDKIDRENETNDLLTQIRDYVKPTKKEEEESGLIGKALTGLAALRAPGVLGRLAGITKAGKAGLLLSKAGGAAGIASKIPGVAKLITPLAGILGAAKGVKGLGGIGKMLGGVGKVAKFAKVAGPVGLVVGALFSVFDGAKAGVEEYAKSGSFMKAIGKGLWGFVDSFLFGIPSWIVSKMSSLLKVGSFLMAPMLVVFKGLTSFFSDMITKFKSVIWDYMPDFMKRNMPSMNPDSDFSQVTGSALTTSSAGFTGTTSSSEKVNLMKDVYDSFVAEGVNPEAAKAFVGEVNRENSFNKGTMFGNHLDPYNKKNNIGMISWQGDRADALRAYLSRLGLMEGGKIKQSKEAIAAQARFMLNEMKTGGGGTGSKGKETYKYVTGDNVDPQVAMNMIGQYVIKWRINDQKYRASGLRNRQVGYNTIDSALAVQSSKRSVANLNPQPNTSGKESNSPTQVNSNTVNNNTVQTKTRPSGVNPNAAVAAASYGIPSYLLVR